MKKKISWDLGYRRDLGEKAFGCEIYKWVNKVGPENGAFGLWDIRGKIVASLKRKVK